MKKFILLLLALLCLAGCTRQALPTDKLQVAASFYPMAEFTRNVGGDKIAVQTLVPDGVEPHDWEPAPRDLTRLGHAKIFVYNGHVESWADAALDALAERKITAVCTGKDLDKINGRLDPHIWVSPKKALVQVERITKALCQADPQNSDHYANNSVKYTDELKKLDAALTQLAKTAPKKKFVTAHAAFGHLAADYGLEQIAVAGISPEAEPTPKDLQALVRLVKRENVKYVFMETLATPKLTELLAKETGAQILVLDPIEGLSEQGGQEKLDYLKIMQQNIANLSKALNE